GHRESIAGTPLDSPHGPAGAAHRSSRRATGRPGRDRPRVPLPPRAPKRPPASQARDRTRTVALRDRAVRARRARGLPHAHHLAGGAERFRALTRAAAWLA